MTLIAIIFFIIGMGGAWSWSPPVPAETGSFPQVVINTWPFTNCTDAGWKTLQQTDSAMDAVESTCNTAEYDRSIPTVGYGGSPDEQGNTTLDAFIMDGTSMEAGAVVSMHNVKDAIKVARAVLTYTKHTMLAGWAATEFAREMGFKVEETLSTPDSIAMWKQWRDVDRCQPNFRRNVKPDPQSNCGPYEPAFDIANRAGMKNSERVLGSVDFDHHDTIGAVALDSQGNMAVGTSTNAATHRVPGRVGDSAIPGAGGYVDSIIGGAAGTGDGDVLMRFLLSYETVQLMGRGYSPTQACETSLSQVKQVGQWSGAVVALNKQGEYGAACVGFDQFSLSVRDAKNFNSTRIVPINCKKIPTRH